MSTDYKREFLLEEYKQNWAYIHQCETVRLKQFQIFFLVVGVFASFLAYLLKGESDVITAITSKYSFLISVASTFLSVFLFCLLLFMLVQFFIYAYSGLKWPTLLDHFENTFVHPGNSINLSDTRGTLAIYPAFVFFIFCLPGIKKGVTSGHVKRFLLTTIAINLILILVVFAGPRVKF
uniref:hypothetical protein n=1 Tax=uncultured Pseudoalteromonas sp. TaxID=114053 RepID=UPI00262E5CC9